MVVRSCLYRFCLKHSGDAILLSVDIAMALRSVLFACLILASVEASFNMNKIPDGCLHLACYNWTCDESNPTFDCNSAFAKAHFECLQGKWTCVTTTNATCCWDVASPLDGGVWDHVWSLVAGLEKDCFAHGATWKTVLLADALLIRPSTRGAW